MKVQNVEYVRATPDPHGSVIPILHFRVTSRDGRSWEIPLDFSYQAAREVGLMENFQNGRPHAWLEQNCRHYLAVTVSALRDEDNPVEGEWLITNVDHFRMVARFSRNSPGEYLPAENFRRPKWPAT